jgi:hypothetical protein
MEMRARSINYEVNLDHHFVCKSPYQAAHVMTSLVYIIW